MVVMAVVAVAMVAVAMMAVVITPCRMDGEGGRFGRDARTQHSSSILTPTSCLSCCWMPHPRASGE